MADPKDDDERDGEEIERAPSAEVVRAVSMPPAEAGGGDGARVVIASADRAEADAVAKVLVEAGHEVAVATTRETAAALIGATKGLDVVVADATFADGGPGDAIDAAARAPRPVEVVVVAEAGDVIGAVAAMARGALAYLPKPINSSELLLHVARAAERARLERETAELRLALDERYGFEGIVGTSMKMRRMIDQLRAAAPTDASVLITGESGTGKELVARSIHWNSPRRRGPFVALHLHATPAGLLESELFGHKRGSFTGATADRVGKLEAADRGTLFLDEVGDMPIETQSKLLRVLETRTFERVGSNQPVTSDFRLIAATNQGLAKMMKDGKFREELFYRLNVVPIHLPPLRERTGDIPFLVDRFLRDAAERYKKNVESITPAALRALARYSWPGNIRELKNAIDRMVVLARGSALDEPDVPADLRGGEPEEATSASLAGRSLEDVEREQIRQTLALTQGNRKEAARMLKIGERTLYRKIERYGLS